MMRLIRSYLGNKKRLTVLLLGLLVTFYLCSHLYIFRDLVYILRPVFDRDRMADLEQLPQFYDQSLNASQLCSIHGWSRRRTPVRVIDAVIFSVELDILEVRLRELWDVVDLFLVLESNCTFSGEPKSLVLRQNLARFAWAAKKLRVDVVDNLQPLELGESPFKNENAMRDAIGQMVKRFAQPGDLIIIADVDEIPRARTIDLLRQCDSYPSPLHLQLRTYFYSFEFYFSLNDAWVTKVQVYDPAHFAYSHSKTSRYMLVDAGWHCTFCFRRLSDFRFKMLSYSHNDRLMGRTELLTDDEIQRRICEGENVFDMYPEVYSFREMVLKFGAIPKTTSFVDLPRGLVKYEGRFKFLFGGKDCLREDYNGDYYPK